MATRTDETATIKPHHKMNNTNTVNGTYGSDETPCTIYTFEDCTGMTWYAVAGSVNVNATHEPVVEGVDVETLEDSDAMTCGGEINSEEDLAVAMDV